MLRALIERYLEGTESGFAEWLLGNDRDEVHGRIRPAELYTRDDSERIRDAERPAA